MRTLHLRLFSDDGKLFVSEELFQLGEERTLGEIISELSHRLDVLERDGPWKPEAKLVELGVSPGPQEAA